MGPMCRHLIFASRRAAECTADFGVGVTNALHRGNASLDGAGLPLHGPNYTNVLWVQHDERQRHCSVNDVTTA